MRGVKQSLFGEGSFGHVCVDGVQISAGSLKATAPLGASCT